MNSIWLFQLTISISIILSTSLVVKNLLEITLSRSFLLSISLITLFIMLLDILGLYKFSINILIIISIIPFFFSSIRKVIIEKKFLIIEFILALLILFYFSNDRILMDEDELYFWAIKYKYFVIQLSEFGNYNFNNIKEPFQGSGYGNAAAIFQTFITSFIGFNEGGAIFANNIIIVCAFYFLFGDKVEKFTHRILYFLIIYLILNNLSFGLLSIYNDPTVAILYAVLIYYLINNFNYKDLKNISLLLILIIFFINIHRIAIVLMSFLFILLFLKYSTNKNIILKNWFKSILGLIFIILFIYIFLRLMSSYNLNIKKNFHFDLYDAIYFIKTIFFSKSYNSQFGVSYNEIINFLKIDLIKLPEYIWHNFIWYSICIYIALINGKETKKINIFFLIIFLIFSFMIIINKVYINNVSSQVFGRYISFIIIPFILVNLLYLQSFRKNEQSTFFLILFFLILSTPKKTFGFFFPSEFYSKYDQWNKNYYEIREKHKELYFEIKNIFQNKTYNALVIFKDDNVIYAEHPSIYSSALKLDLYPNNINIIRTNTILNEGLNLKDKLKKINLTDLKKIDVLIYYNLDNNEKNYSKKKIKEFEEELKIKLKEKTLYDEIKKERLKLFLKEDQVMLRIERGEKQKQILKQLRLEKQIEKIRIKEIKNRIKKKFEEKINNEVKKEFDFRIKN